MGLDERPNSNAAAETATAASGGIDIAQALPGTAQPEANKAAATLTRRDQQHVAAVGAGGELPMHPSDLPQDVRGAVRRQRAEQGAIGEHAEVNEMRAGMSPPTAPIDFGLGPDASSGNRDSMPHEHHKGWIATAGDKILEVAHDLAEAVGIEAPREEDDGDDYESDARKVPAIAARMTPPFAPSEEAPHVERRQHHRKKLPDDAQISRMRARMSPPSAPVDFWNADDDEVGNTGIRRP